MAENHAWVVSITAAEVCKLIKNGVCSDPSHTGPYTRPLVHCPSHKVIVLYEPNGSSTVIHRTTYEQNGAPPASQPPAQSATSGTFRLLLKTQLEYLEQQKKRVAKEIQKREYEKLRTAGSAPKIGPAAEGSGRPDASSPKADTASASTAKPRSNGATPGTAQVDAMEAEKGDWEIVQDDIEDWEDVGNSE